MRRAGPAMPKFSVRHHHQERGFFVWSKLYGYRLSKNIPTSSLCSHTSQRLPRCRRKPFSPTTRVFWLFCFKLACGYPRAVGDRYKPMLSFFAPRFRFHNPHHVCHQESSGPVSAASLSEPSVDRFLDPSMTREILDTLFSMRPCG